MIISYKKLWKLLIDKDKLTHSENVSTAILLKICAVLHYDVADIMEVVEAESIQQESKVSR